MTNILQTILASKREELRQLPPMSASNSQAKQTGNRQRFVTALTKSGLSVIAEIKRKSPSAGAIDIKLDATAQATLYQQAGVDAISVLTDQTYFGGSLQDLQTLAAIPKQMPLLRKDFIIDPRQIEEAVTSGASAVLLIAAALTEDSNQLETMIRLSHDFNLAALVEVHTATELQKAIDAGASIIGINNRNLDTFEVNLNTAETLRAYIPAGIITVAESGIKTPAEAARMHAAGFDAVLIGEALVRSEDPKTFITDIRALTTDSEASSCTR